MSEYEETVSRSSFSVVVTIPLSFIAKAFVVLPSVMLKEIYTVTSKEKHWITIIIFLAKKNESSLLINN